MSLKLLGHLGSPYSRKFRAFLRYKQIPFEFIRSQTEEADLLPKSKIPIVPAIYFPDESYATGHTDSTPLIRRIDILKLSVICKINCICLLPYIYELDIQTFLFTLQVSLDSAFDSSCQSH